MGKTINFRNSGSTLEATPAEKADTEGTEQLSNRPPLLVLISFGILGVLIFVAIFADVISPYGYREQNLQNRLAPPVFLGGDWAYFLGTDSIGRDLLSRLIYATRFSIAIAFLGTTIGATLGTILGLIAAHKRGLTGEVIMMAVDIQASLPFMLIALAVLAFFGNDLTLFILIIGYYGWEGFARLSRVVALAARSQGYASAISALGASEFRLYAMHILPNIASILIVQFTLNFPQTILLETSLSFLGLGVQPPLTSLGQLLSDGRSYLLTAWWIAVAPGVVILMATLSISLIGDWLRDRLDPTLKEG
jgi:peptide/nickel transport system permease protein